MTFDVTIQAIQYAAGELSAADAAVFEARMETDQSARDALAEAVLLMAAVRSQPKPLATAPKFERRSRWVALFAVAAASVAMVALLRLPGGRLRDRDKTAVVQTWTELAPAAGWSEAAAASESDHEWSVQENGQDVPDWIVAAVLDGDDVPAKEGDL